MNYNYLYFQFLIIIFEYHNTLENNTIVENKYIE
jgi:hypothetical protein